MVSGGTVGSGVCVCPRKMFGGQDASGRKVSLLNDNHEPPPTTSFSAASSASTTTTTTVKKKARPTLFTRPNLPHRCRHSYPASLSSQQSKESSTQSSCSSISCSPPHSPPPPSLVRLDSQSSSTRSLNTPSPMSHNYNFDPSDQNGINKPQPNGLPYYTTNGSRHYNAEDIGNSYPIEQSIPFNSYPRMQSQQPPPPPAYPPLDPFSTQHASFHRAPVAPMPLYQDNLLPNPLNQSQRHPPHHHPNSFSMPSPLLHIQPNLPPLPMSTTEPNFASPSSTTPSTPITATSATSPVRGTPTITTPTATTTSNNASNPAAPVLFNKKKHPCPHAHQYGCTDTFTTSGHAARHGKKHTGERNISCPNCDKRFTRKDNMKQHQRTHKENQSDQPTTRGSSTPSPTTTSHSGSRRRTSSGSGAIGATTTPTTSAIAAASILTEPVDYHDGEEDADGDVDMDVTPLAPNNHGQIQAPKVPMGPPPINHRAQLQRPSIGNTKRGGSLEQRHVSADMDADGEVVDDDTEGAGHGTGGLDALAAAGGLARRR